MVPAGVAAQLEPFRLPERVLNTMAEARAPSTQCLFETTLKWSIFSTWCQDCDLDPVTSDVSVVLSFLQEMLDKPRLGYVLKVLSTPFRAQFIVLSALPPSTGSQELSLLCPVRALRVCIERFASYRKSEQLFVGHFGNCALLRSKDAYLAGQSPFCLNKLSYGFT